MTFPRSHRRPGRVLRRDTGQQPAASMVNWVRLASSGWYVQLEDVRSSADVLALLGADACWHFSVEDWHLRRPHRWQRAQWRSWRLEEAALAAEQVALVAAASPLRTLRPFTDAAS